MQAHKEKQLEYNLGVLRRRDAQITKLLNMSAHVVLSARALCSWYAPRRAAANHAIKPRSPRPFRLRLQLRLLASVDAGVALSVTFALATCCPALCVWLCFASAR
eukprot:6214360-Pleurochrysis_carterae.AAC.2